MASVTFVHAHDHVVVDFNGVLDWAAAQELVQVLDTVVDHYFYAEVELVITSPGGKLRAFENVLDAAARLREQGVRLRTRVVSTAGSAAAVLASLGDERIGRSWSDARLSRRTHSERCRDQRPRVGTPSRRAREH